MKLKRLLAGIICASMAVVQLPVGAFASTLVVDEGSELVVEEEIMDTIEASEDSLSNEEAVVSDTDHSLLGTDVDPSYTWEGFSYYKG